MVQNNMEYHRLEITSIEPTAQNAVCVEFDIPSDLTEKFNFVPGQHLTLRHEIDGENLRRFYSICSQNSKSAIRIGIRNIENGRFSGFLNHEAKIGDRLEILAPRGRFCLADQAKGKHIIAFAAGSGITPIYAILVEHLKSDENSTATLINGNRTTGSIMLRQDLGDLKDIYLHRFQIIQLLSRERQDVEQFNGRIDKKSIKNLIEGKLIYPESATQIFICGPSTMINETKESLINNGASPQAIMFERFTANEARPVKPSTQIIKAVASGVNVAFVLDGVERNFSITDAGDSVLNAAHKAGFELPFSCAGGMCATCRCKIVEGQVEMAVNYALEPWELEAGFVLACQSRPKTRKIRLDFDAS